MLRFLLFIALALQVSAQETLFRQVFDTATDTHVEVTGLFSKPSSSGYYPVRVKISNNLQVERTIRLDFESGSRNENQSTSTFSFKAPAGKAVTRDIMVPLTPPGNYGSTSLAVTLSGSMGKSNGSVYSSFGEKQPVSLLSEALFTPNGSALDSEINSSTTGTTYRGSSQFASKFDPKQLPDNWLAFSGFDSVIMTDTDWGNVPPGPRNAILSWVRLGGQLIIYTSGSSTAPTLGLPAEAGLGSITIESIPSSLKLDAPKTVALVSGSPIPTRQTSLNEDFDKSWALQSDFGLRTFQYGMFICVLVVFGVLVGPVNLFVFAKAGQRHRLFITTPIISLGASLILILLIFIQDGMGGSGIRRVLMEVRPDDGLNAAYIHQEQFSRTGVLGSSNFTINTPSLFLPVNIAHSRWARYTNGATGKFNLQPADGKLEASGDWFESRSEHGHILSAVVSTRGRIESTDTPGSYLSTFDFPIQTIYFLDDKGDWQRAENIVAGKRFTPVGIDLTMANPAINQEANAFSGRNKKLFEAAKDRPGHFIAITDQAPGIDTNPGIRWKTKTVITGPVVKP